MACAPSGQCAGYRNVDSCGTPRKEAVLLSGSAGSAGGFVGVGFEYCEPPDMLGSGVTLQG